MLTHGYAFRTAVVIALAAMAFTPARAVFGDPSTPLACTTPVFINEFHYDNAGTDTGEFVEIFGPAGTDLTGWSIVLYNGFDGAPYDTDSLSGTIPNQQNGFGTIYLSYPTNGIQNGSPDGFALVNNSNVVQQFLSYEGTFTANGGPANGMTSTDVGLSEGSATPVGYSLQLTGTGECPEHFTWSGPSDDSPGAINSGQNATPTAVTLRSFAAHSAVPRGLGTPIAVAMLAIVGVGSVWLGRRCR